MSGYENIVTISRLLHYSFNADSSAVAIGTKYGFVIFNLDPIVQRLHEIFDGMRIVELLYCTSLILLVPSGDKPGSSPRKLILWVCSLNICFFALSITLVFK